MKNGQQVLFSTGQIAELIGVTPSAVRLWAQSGKLVSRRTPGGHRRVSAADLVEFLTTTNRR